MKIILNEAEKEYIQNLADTAEINEKGIIAFYEEVMAANFEEDINSVLNDYENEIRKDF